MVCWDETAAESNCWGKMIRWIYSVTNAASVIQSCPPPGGCLGIRIWVLEGPQSSFKQEETESLGECSQFWAKWGILISESFFFSIQQWYSNWAIITWRPPKASMGTDKIVLEETSSRFAIFKCVFFSKIDLSWKHLEAASQFSFPSLLPHSLPILKKKKTHFSAIQRMQQTQGAQQRNNWQFWYLQSLHE